MDKLGVGYRDHGVARKGNHSPDRIGFSGKDSPVNGRTVGIDLVPCAVIDPVPPDPVDVGLNDIKTFPGHEAETIQTQGLVDLLLGQPLMGGKGLFMDDVGVGSCKYIPSLDIQVPANGG